MQVVATAGHVDHGKSTLIRALTGTDPDRLAEEKKRGLTIDLGFAWTQLPSGRGVSFVDVPGHERFLGNMLAGVGPAPIVCFVVAADDGWQAQSADHRDAIAALGIDQGILVVTRADLAPDRVDEVRSRMRSEFAGTGLEDAPDVAVSATTGEGLDELRELLDVALDAARVPSGAQRVRLWVDRSFTIDGSGTVITGTLAAGTLRRGEHLEVAGIGRRQPAIVRGLQSRGEQVDRLGPVSRAAVNLRGVAADGIGRGDALLTPGAWWLTDTVDVRLVSGLGLRQGPGDLVAHIGTAAVPVHTRPFNDEHARLTFARRLPIAVGDRIVLRSSGARTVHAGVTVLDVDPPGLLRRGAGARRAAALSRLPEGGDVRAEVARRGAMDVGALHRMGVRVPPDLPQGVRRAGPTLVDEGALQRWGAQLAQRVHAHRQSDALSRGLPRKAAVDALSLPLPHVLDLVIAAAGLVEAGGWIQDPRQAGSLGPAEAAVAALERSLSESPFRAPEADELRELGLAAPHLAAAARQGRLLRLPDDVILLPSAPALAMRDLARLPQPFTTSQARQALGTTRRVAIPLLEHLDARGWTRRVDGGHREIVRGG